MWNGTIGTLIANDIKNPYHKIYWVDLSISIDNNKGYSVVPPTKYKNTIEINKNKEPNNVYKKNWYKADNFLFLLPKYPIKKNIGNKTASKLIKKYIKSKTKKTIKDQKLINNIEYKNLTGITETLL